MTVHLIPDSFDNGENSQSYRETNKQHAAAQLAVAEKSNSVLTAPTMLIAHVAYEYEITQSECNNHSTGRK